MHIPLISKETDLIGQNLTYKFMYVAEQFFRFFMKEEGSYMQISSFVFLLTIWKFSQLYFPSNFHFRMIYNSDKLKQILPVKSYQSMDGLINGVIISSILPEFLKIIIRQWRKNSWNEIKRMGSYTQLSKNRQLQLRLAMIYVTQSAMCV